jgi:hypothetical protein
MGLGLIVAFASCCLYAAISTVSLFTGAIVAPSSSTTFGFLAGAVKNPGSMSVENGGKLTNPLLNNTCILQIIFGTLTDPCYCISSGINAGKASHHVPTPSAPIMTTMLGHCEKSGTALTADAGMLTEHSRT